MVIETTESTDGNGGAADVWIIVPAFNEAQIGKVLPVLFEKPGRNPGQLVGKSPYLQSVHASAPESMLGKIAPARIEGVTPRALAGVICGDGR